jgi:hypothetical protein
MELPSHLRAFVAQHLLLHIVTIIDHKYDKAKVVSTISHATNALKLKDTLERNGKGKEALLIFSKQGS